MKPKLTLVILVSVLFFACKKSNTNTPVGTLLNRIIYIGSSGPDTLDYTYDANQRLIGMLFSSSTRGSRINRNSAGIITTINMYDRSSSAILTNDEVNYDVLTSHYISDVFYYTANPNKRDSSVYTYTNDNVSELSYYTIDPADPNLLTYKITYKNTYTYDATGNPIHIAKAYYNTISGNINYIVDYDYTFDNKINPNPLSTVEFLVVHGPTEIPNSPNNLLSFNALAPTSDYGTISYNYNSNNMPATAHWVYNQYGTNSVGDTQYFY